MPTDYSFEASGGFELTDFEHDPEVQSEVSNRKDSTVYAGPDRVHPRLTDDDLIKLWFAAFLAKSVEIFNGSLSEPEADLLSEVYLRKFGPPHV